MHINGSIPVTIAHVKENRKTGGGGGGGGKGKIEVLCGHNDHVGHFYKFLQWWIV